MRLKYLELHGYKTFASRTSFAFDGGVTAVVGPNGSGKSNIADAIRWVLGEQSFRALRGKRTEDMIFSGSTQRARLGMASVSLAFDNSDGWLPVEYSEVAVTRRAYRSGENEYLINGHRVRLADIVELLGTSGLAQRTYTVIGQGLVDAVLSLRPDDRRALFEEAAGIAVHRTKRSEALARLEETRSNLVRVYDILSEIAPRLQRLEREAERARLRGLLEQQLEGLLRTWYGFRWHQVQLELRRARDLVARREVRRSRERESLEGILKQMSALRARQSALREQVSGWHRESSELHRQLEEVQRDLAVWQERARLLSLQGNDLESELAPLGLQVEEQAFRVRAADEALNEGEKAVSEKDGQVELAQRELAQHEARREEISRALADAQSAVLERSVEAANRRSRMAQLAEQQTELAKQAAEHGESLRQVKSSLARLREQVRLATDERARLSGEREEQETRIAAVEADLASARDRQADLRGASLRASLVVQQFEERQDLIERQRSEGEGLHPGVRAVLAAASEKRQASRGHADGPSLAGVLGTVAQLVEVPEAYEVAVQVALGNHLQDIVVESWPRAEAAIGFLRDQKRGRATFLPLDTVRPPSRLAVPRIEGVIGCGADLVQAGKHLMPVIDLLLGRTLVVRDLKTARQAFDSLQGGFQIVSLSGEVLRSSGSVTGGQDQGKQQNWLLAREREWRDLPARLAQASREADAAASALREAEAHERGARQQLASLVVRLQSMAKGESATEAELGRLGRLADQTEQQAGWYQRLVDEAGGRSADLRAQEAALARELSRLEAEMLGAQEQVAAVQAQVDALRGDGLYLVLSEARSAAAVARRNREHRRAILEAARERQAELGEQQTQKEQRLALLRQEEAALARDIQAQVSRQKVIDGWLSGLAQKTGPAEAEVARLEAEYERLATEESSIRTRLREAETAHSEAQLACSRVEDSRHRLRRQIMDDFGLVEMEPMQDQPDQPPLPLAELVSTLPVIEAPPPGLEEDTHQLRAQIRRLGSVNPSALAEYDEVRDRHAFLSGQAADLEEAALRLQEVIAELDEVMRTQFGKTFEAVQVRFQANFTRLFAGGSARLNLTEPEDLSATGVEITARPPGKRQQTLALLSGGERSLTAVALIFAFLQTSPPPFCILDEVDAMLDEANVQRFRAMLLELARTTQFIIITHNRTTVQAADTIYGVTMGEDNASQVVSLRLEGDRMATAEGAPVDPGGD